MEFLEHTFLEAPFLVYITTGLAELITVAIWQKTRAKRVLVMLVLWPAIAIAVAALAAAVQTDREKVHAAWTGIDQAIQAQDTARLMRNVAPDFQSTGLDRDGLERLAEQARAAMAPGSLKLSRLVIERIEGSQATATVIASYAHSGSPRAATEWALTFSPQPDVAWRLEGVACRKPRNLNLRSAVSQLKQITRGGG